MLFIGALIFSASCSKTDDGSVSEKAQIMVDLKSNLTFVGENASKAVASRAVDEVAYKDVNNYTVTLFKNQTGENVHSAKYSEWGLKYQIEPKVEYRIDAVYGNPEFKASYDELYMFGSTTFQLNEGETKTISFQCKPKAAKVKMVLSEDFDTYFRECSISIKTKHLTEPFVMTLADKDKELYIYETDEDNVDLAFSFVDRNGKSATQSKTVAVTPQTFLKINMSPNITEIAGGKFGLDITVDTSVTDENINIVVPNDQFK